MSTSHIAVCTDFSEASRRAFPIAAALARTLPAKVSLVYLAERPGVPAFARPGVGPPQVEEDLAAYFESIETRLVDLISTDSTFDAIDTRVRLLRDSGSGFEALIEFLKGEAISLVITTTHGYTGARRFVFGSFASKILHSAPCPVLVVREHPSGSEVDGKLPTRIFVATDLTPRSARALDLACSWARQFGASLLVHNVVEKPRGLTGYPTFMLEGWFEHEQKLRDESCEKLAEYLAGNGEGIDARYAVTAGEPAEEILREIDDFKADLVVMGTHGRSGFQEFMLGSVVQKVIGRTRSSVLVVRPPPEEN